MKYGVGVAIVVALILMIGGRCLTVVPAGHVGVHDLFGKVSDQEIPAGLHLKHPFANVAQMSVKTQDYTMSFEAGEGKVKGRSDAISALTREGLEVALDVTMLYHLDPDKASEVYKTIGLNYSEVVVRPKVREAIRSSTAAYDAKDIYSEKRQELQKAIEDDLALALAERGIIVEKVLLRHVGLPAMIATAIQQKLQAEQNTQAMKFVLEKEHKEAERRTIEAGGIASAQKVIAQSLTPEYLQWRYVTTLEKLAGSENTTFVITPFDQKLVPMLPLGERK